MQSGVHSYIYAVDAAKQKMKLQLDRPIAVRDAIMACRNCGIISMMGVYAGFIDKFPLGAFMNRGLTLRTGQCHVHRYMKPLLDHIQAGDIDPTFIITHRMKLEDAPKGFGAHSDQERLLVDELHRFVRFSWDAVVNLVRAR